MLVERRSFVAKAALAMHGAATLGTAAALFFRHKPHAARGAMRPSVGTGGTFAAADVTLRVRLLPRLAPLVVTLAVLGVTSAQVTIVVTGTLQGTLDGESRTWYSLATETGGSLSSQTRLNEMGFAGFESYLLEITWFADQNLASVGKLTILGSLSSSLDECPCDVDRLDIRYFLTPDPLVEYYSVLEAQMIVDAFTVGDDGNLSASGSLDATLGYVEGPLVSLEPDPDTTVRITGAFGIDRMFTDFEP